MIAKWSKSTRASRGFTLVELLVVIGIIALLISILLPALNKARRAANTIACASNIKQIVAAVLMYANQYDGYIPGSPGTTGGYSFTSDTTNYSDSYCPDISQTFDWQAPVAKLLGYTFDIGATLQDRITGGAPGYPTSRFNTLINLPVFTCPENQFLCPEYINDGNLNNGLIITMPSYSMALAFLVINQTKFNSGTAIAVPGSPADFTISSTYVPKLNKIGKPAAKVCISDGGKYSENVNPDPEPNYVCKYDPSTGSVTVGGAYADLGPCFAASGDDTTHTVALDRSAAPGNGYTGIKDDRIYGFRHGVQAPHAETGSYKFNVGFYDGHVETMDEISGSNPALWAPSGAVIPWSEFAQAADLVAFYKLPSGQPYSVP